MELTLVPLLLPVIQDELGLAIGELAWVFNSYGFSVAFGVLLGGWLGDNFSTRKVFAVGVLLFAFGSLLVGYADSFETMIVGRVVQGFGGGVFSPLVPILLTRAQPDKPGKVLIVWGSVAGYVAAFAPLFYSGLFANYGWKLAFVAFALISLAALAIAQTDRTIEEVTPRPEPKPRYSTVLQSKEMWVMFAYVFCTYGSITYYLFRLPLWLAENEFQVVTIGIILSSMWLSFSIASTLLRNRVDGPRVTNILIAAPLFIAAGFPLVYFCEASVCLYLSPILIGTGLACSNAPSTQLIFRLAPKGTNAMSASLDITFARMGGVATVALLAESVFLQSYTMIVVMCLFALLSALSTARKIDERVWV